MSETRRLPYFPISFFSMIMGLAGYTLVWMQCEELKLYPIFPSEYLAVLALGLFLVLLSIYVAKAVKHPDKVRAELHHPVMLSFFPTISISLILIGTMLALWFPKTAFYIWTTGAVLQLILTLYILSKWIHHDHFEIHHISPAWFIPVVGNILVPLAGIQYAPIELNWFFFSIGLLFWIVLFTIIMYRMIFHHPMPEALLPTLFIIIAPPAVGFAAYLNLSPELDNFARILYYSALFLTMLLLSQGLRFLRLPFTLSWWAYSFPLAAITIATFAMYEETGTRAFLAIGYALHLLLTAVIATLLLRTFLAARRGEICRPPQM
ncbi:SLAC1 anion channel family protein [Solemya elarraichensis gill symbiont]|uniref:C4-dicarboxylate ABC transporter n=1 Tax=Solemya elarraichensis gill symbiont TaxID=1918949 RepID=A0A1T2LC16_9GAMM|nr:SLAC1 anion channel family protein [Solemya elarraichensis gill symbiont]OOZ42643.1 C4-dicarboxylate ABC transporter [Solemya elarraichensis gill symbiont]